MADATTYSFDLREATIALLKIQGIREGRWVLAVEFNFAAMAMGVSPEEARPTGIVQVNRLQLMRAPDGTPSVPQEVDAASI